MAAPVTALQPLKLPPGPATATPEQLYWRSFKSQLLIPSPHSSPVTHISYPAGTNSPEAFAVTCGNRVQTFSTRTRKLIKTITRFGADDLAHSGDIRPDSRVLVAGSDSGAIQVFDINSRAILKTWKEHSQPVWTTKWSPSVLTSMMSTSDDRTVKLWDLSAQESETTFHGHQDYVRSGCFMPGNGSNLLVSGSYDQTVRLWDRRTPGKSVMVFKYSAPVESVLPLQSSTSLLASADNQIAVLDLVAARTLEVLRTHQKTVMALSLASNGTRVISGGLDGHIKVYETTGWRVVAGAKYPSPILSLSVVPSGSQHEDRHLAVGMQSGVLSFKTRLSGRQKVEAREREKEMDALLKGDIEKYDLKTAKKRGRGDDARQSHLGSLLDYDGHGAEIVVQGRPSKRGRRLPGWDHALRHGRYAESLDLALKLNNPVTILTVLTALVHRSALNAALSGRDEVSLVPLLTWLVKHITDPAHAELLSRVSALVLDHYAGELGQSAKVDKLVHQLHERVRRVVEGAQVAEATKGMLDAVLAGV